MTDIYEKTLGVQLRFLEVAFSNWIKLSQTPLNTRAIHDIPPEKSGCFLGRSGVATQVLRGGGGCVQILWSREGP